MSKTNNLIKYWRNSLADAERMNIDPKRLEGAFAISKDAIKKGAIDSSLTEKIFQEVLRLKKEDSSIQDIFKGFVYVLICPIKAMAKVERGAENNTYDQIITPLWIPAVVSKTGDIQPKADSFPWIPRDLLEPSFGRTVTVGSVWDVDDYLTIHRQTFKQEDTWESLWEYSNGLFKHVTNQSLDEFELENYEVDPYAYILIESTEQGSAKNIIKLYDMIIRDNQIPSLLKQFASPVEERLLPLLNDADERTICKKHIGQMGYKYPLSSSQREALHHFLTLEHGEILAVNGPPGTGKTTLLQSVIATMWVEAALNKTEPPVIVAASANNQAVTNIIDSFGKIDEPEKWPLAGRWLNGVYSYGLYCPSQVKIKEAQDKFQVANYLREDKGPFPQTVEDPSYVEENKKYFLKKCSEYVQRKVSTLSSCLEILHANLKNTVSEITRGVELFQRYTEYKAEIANRYLAYNGVEQFIELMELELKRLDNEMNELRAVEDGWQKHFNTEHWLLTLFAFLPPVKNRIMIRNRYYNNSNDYKIEADFSSKIDILNVIDGKKKELISKKEMVEGKLKTAKIEVVKLKALEDSFMRWLDKNKMEWEKYGGNSHTVKMKEINNLYHLLEFMDTNLRYKAFKIATHYWECSWLIQMEEQIEGNYKETLSKENLQKKWRRYAKLTPGIVSTFYMIPKYFNAWQGDDQPLYEFIDLLIIDEAGQASPEIAAAAFSLAKKSIVVGDTLQIEPVWSISKRIDIANLKSHQLITSDSDREIDAFFDTGLAASCGNVMKIAQRASKYQKYPDERGMFLSEHRRCFDDIIAYCNELAYKGRLQPKRGNESGMLLPYMGYKDIKGKATKSGGSWGNKKEAEAIARWIKENQEALEHFYTERDEKKRKRDIKDIIGIVTPFAYQGKLIKSELRRLNIKDITVGTVHSLQGAERNVIIFSSVYDFSQKGSNYFFDNGPNMLNVAVSRAKDSFLVFGDMEIFNSNDDKKPSSILLKYLKKLE